MCVVCSYFLLQTSFNYYQQAGIQIGDLQALNATSIVADKGSDHPYQCAVRCCRGGQRVSSVLMGRWVVRRV